MQTGITSLPPEILATIATYVEDWKSWIFTCRAFANTNSEEMILKHSNPLWSLIRRHPNANWDLRSVSYNPCTTFEMVLANPEKRFDYHVLASRLKFPITFLIEAIQIYDKWDTLDDFEQELYKFQYYTIKNVENLSTNPWINYWFVLYTRDLDWDYDALSRNMFPHELFGEEDEHNDELDRLDCTLAMINRHTSESEWKIFTDEGEDFTFLDLSDHPKLTLEFYKKHKDRTWDYDILSGNPAISCEFINTNPNASWNWDILAHHKDINRIFSAYPDKPWDYENICCNENLELSTFLKLPELDAEDWSTFSYRGKITLKQVIENPQLPWMYIHLLSNPNIPFKKFLNEFTTFDNGLIVYTPALTCIEIEHYRNMSRQDYLDDRNGNFAVCHVARMIFRRLKLEQIDQTHMADLCIYDECEQNKSWLVVESIMDNMSAEYISINSFDRKDHIPDMDECIQSRMNDFIDTYFAPNRPGMTKKHENYKRSYSFTYYEMIKDFINCDFDPHFDSEWSDGDDLAI
jgi:hypothetical protein